MGAWIEIRKSTQISTVYIVAPLVGAWIEILITRLSDVRVQSLLSWERGLKFTLSMALFQPNSIVAPLVGAWIEINREIL